MDKITKRIYNQTIKNFKDLSDGEKKIALMGAAYDVDSNLEILNFA